MERHLKRGNYLNSLIRQKLYARKYINLRKDFFLGFGKEEGIVKMQEWFQNMREKAKLKILMEPSE